MLAMLPFFLQSASADPASAAGLCSFLLQLQQKQEGLDFQHLYLKLSLCLIQQEGGPSLSATHFRMQLYQSAAFALFSQRSQGEKAKNLF